MQVRTPKIDELENLTLFVAERYADNELYTYVSPNKEVQEKFTHGFLKFRLAFGLKKNAAKVTEDGKAVAVWLAPGDNITPEDLASLGGYEAMGMLGEEGIKKFQLFVAASSKMENEYAPMPHYHLSPIAVSQEAEGKGYASALLRSRLEEFDKNGEYCYLDALNERNKSIYEHFGFKTMWEGYIPGTPVKHIAMLRAPK